MKRLLSFMLATTIIFGSSAALAANYKVEYQTGVAVTEDLSPVRVAYNGDLIPQEMPSVVKNARSLVPVRYLAEASGAAVAWDQASSTVTISKDGRTVQLTIGSPTAYIDGNAVSVTDGVAPVLVNDCTLVPLRFVSEALGLNVDWDAANFVAIVSSPDYVPPAEGYQFAVAAQTAQEGGTVYTQYNMTFEQMVQAQANRLTTINRGGGWVQATTDEIRQYLDVSNIAPGSDQYFQFLDLSKPSGISADEFNKILRGSLSGMGQAFVDAANLYGINDAYLVAHAILETGNGSSKLANGGSMPNGRAIYNMYGYRAVDSDPVGEGSRFAYQEGWFTPYDAIVGGAKHIRERYIGQGQNTLYKMRWNPDINNIWKQYATDIRWASVQVKNIKAIYDSCPQHVLSFDVPVYQ